MEHVYNNDGFSIGLSTTHGIQLNRFFIGIGAGIQMMMDIDDGLTLPVYADFRYDFFGVHSSNFFISVKAGYKFGINYQDNPESWCGISGLDITPNIGVRFRLRPNLGINLALNFTPLDVKKVKFNYDSTTDITTRTEKMVFRPRVGLSIGVDF